jgi:hypothetical protein
LSLQANNFRTLSESASKTRSPAWCVWRYAAVSGFQVAAVLGRWWALSVSANDPGITGPDDPHWREKLKRYCAVKRIEIMEVGDALYIGPEVQSYCESRRRKRRAQAEGVSEAGMNLIPLCLQLS